MELFIDHLSKQLARTTSRRSMLGTTFRAAFGAFLSTTWMGKLRAATSSISCQMCIIPSQQCGLPCPTDTTKNISQEAQQFSAYVTLQNFLSANFTTGQTTALITGPNPFRGVLGTTYIGSDPTETAMLFFVEGSESGASFVLPGNTLSAFALQYRNGTPALVYAVDTNGQVQQVLIPHTTSSFSAESMSSTMASGPNAAVSENNAAGSLLSLSTCNALKAGLNLACNSLLAAGRTSCILELALSCGLLTDFIAEGICVALANSICSGGCAALVSATIGTSSFCNCPFLSCGDTCCPQTCPPQNCVNGACQSTPCPDGYSCTNSSDKCTCDNLCGTTCCPLGQACLDAAVSLCCPPDSLACGSICCLAGQDCCGTTCCSSGQTCSNGTCITIGCPPGFCDPTTVCCQGSPNGGPGVHCCVATTCCGPGCCPLGWSCVCNGTGCCPPGQNCGC